MFKFKINHLLVLLALLSFNTLNSSLVADDCCFYPECCNNNRLYIGGFGGGLYSANSPRWSQTGTAFFEEGVGGPLAIDAHGRSNKKSTGFGGAQIGYELAPSCLCSNWNFAPAAEIEAFFFRHTRKGHFINNAAIDRLDEHDFSNRFPMHVGVYMVNGVFSLNNSCFCKFSPYIGGGVGAAHLSIRGASSLQVSPPEPGVNHFNSDRNDSDWAFAAQAKAGLRYNIFERFHIFAEYRFLYIDSSRYIFGSTISPGHAPTSTWIVDNKKNYFNAFVIGLQFDL